MVFLCLWFSVCNRKTCRYYYNRWIGRKKGERYKKAREKLKEPSDKAAENEKWLAEPQKCLNASMGAHQHTRSNKRCSTWCPQRLKCDMASKRCTHISIYVLWWYTAENGTDRHINLLLLVSRATIKLIAFVCVLQCGFAAAWSHEWLKAPLCYNIHNSIICLYALCKHQQQQQQQQ